MVYRYKIKKKKKNYVQKNSSAIKYKMYIYII